MGLQLRVVWAFQWLSHSITPWTKLKAGTLDLVDTMPTQTGKSFMHGPDKSIEPVVFSQGELNSLGSGRFNLSSETCNNYPLQIFSSLIIELSSEELGVRTLQMFRKLVQIPLKDKVSSIPQLIKLVVLHVHL